MTNYCVTVTAQILVVTTYQRWRVPKVKFHMTSCNKNSTKFTATATTWQQITKIRFKLCYHFYPLRCLYYLTIDVHITFTLFVHINFLFLFFYPIVSSLHTFQFCILLSLILRKVVHLWIYTECAVSCLLHVVYNYFL